MSGKDLQFESKVNEELVNEKRNDYGGKIKTINVEWMEEPKFRLEDIEINGKDLSKQDYSEYEKMLTKMTGVKVDFHDMYDIVLDGKLEKALKKHDIKLTMSLTDRS
jgi:hypothetical protein